jgi:hypothetical protein
MMNYLSLIICVTGLVVYFLNNASRKSASPYSATSAEVGRIMFGVGLFVFLMTSVHR